MIKKLKIFLFILIGISFIKCSNVSQKSDLKFGLEINETYTIQIAKDFKLFYVDNGEIKEKNEKITTGYSFQPLRINNNNETEISVTLLSIDLEEEGELGNLKYNSLTDTVQISYFVRPYKELINSNFSLTIASDGSVKDLFGMDSLINRAINKVSFSQEGVKEYLYNSIKEQYSDDVLKETLMRMFAVYPNKAIELNDQWTKKVDLFFEQPLSVKNDYKLIERNNGVAIIDVHSILESDSSIINSQNSLFSNQTFKGEQKGKLQIDEITGWITKGNFFYQIYETGLRDSSLAADSSKTISGEISVKFAPLASDVFKDVEFNPEAVVKGDGVGMTIIGMGVVFSSLLILSIVFYNLTSILNLRKILSKRKTKKTDEKNEIEEKELTGEKNAAIGLAIHLTLSEIHDDESAVLTIKKIGRAYSPWSSKIYGLRQFPK